MTASPFTAPWLSASPTHPWRWSSRRAQPPCRARPRAPRPVSGTSTSRRSGTRGAWAGRRRSATAGARLGRPPCSATKLSSVAACAPGLCRPRRPKGTVNLIGSGRDKAHKGRSHERLCPSGHAGDLGPGLKGLGPGGSILGGREVIAAEVEQVVDPVVGGEEALGLARRLEPLHLPFSPSRRLMGILRSVIQTLVPPVLDRGHDLAFGRASEMTWCYNRRKMGEGDRL